MTWVLQTCVAGLCVTVLLALYRMARGPTVVDRMVAFDLIAVSGVALIAMLSALRSTTYYLELILVYSLLGFLGTVTLTGLLDRTLERRKPDGEQGEERGKDE
jgi:multicomponent Na+:H+ antiporter subunit F